MSEYAIHSLWDTTALFLIAEAVLWTVAFSFGRIIMGVNRSYEVIEKHKRLVDWLWGVPKEFRFKAQRN